MRSSLLLSLATIAVAKLQLHEPALNCILNNHHYWNIFAAHFSEASLVTINILHADDYHNSMSSVVDLVFKYTHVFTKLKKSVSVRHTDLLDNRMDEFSDGRTAYLILVWNHDVLKNFLDLNPDGVVRDKRAKYVILFVYNVPWLCYDFDEYNAHVLARFWKEFGIVDVCINVPCSCQASKIYRYHPFLKRVDVFNTTNLRESPSTLTISLKDLHGYPLKVSMFERKPTAIRVENDPLMKHFPRNTTMSYGGVDGFMMHTIADVLNFKLVFVETDYFKYGRVLENGTAVGSLGDVVYRRVHLAGNGRFVEDYGTDDIEFSQSYQNDYICFVVPKSQAIPHWIMLFHCFSPLSWLALMGVFIFASLTWRALHGQFLTFYAIFTNIPTCLVSLSQTQKLFLFFCLSYNLIINGVFQGSLTTSFSTVSYYPDITTLEALAASGLTISSNVDVWKNDSCTIAKTLREKQRPTNGERALERAALQRDVAAVERRLDATYYIKDQFLDADGLPLVHIVEKCVTAYFISFIVPKGSPFLKKFNHVIRMLNEAGLSKKWYGDVAKSAVYTAKGSTLRMMDDRVLDLNDVQSAFYLLVIGLVVSFFVFLWEVWRKKKCVTRIVNYAAHFDFMP